MNNTILLHKKGSRQKVDIITDDNDDWFLYVNFIEIKTGIINHSSMIIRKDLPGWLSYLSTLGWNKKD
jgi:hypothetical protein